jgi:acetyl esterase/lipase
VRHTVLRAALAVGGLGGARANQYQVAANSHLPHGEQLRVEARYLLRGAAPRTPQPTVVYFHGGFWAAGSKEGSLMSLIPWMEMGWNVVNVEYRLARVAPAPAAVEDGSARCATWRRRPRPTTSTSTGWW